jgi:hypothetical protein
MRVFSSFFFKLCCIREHFFGVFHFLRVVLTWTSFGACLNHCDNRPTAERSELNRTFRRFELKWAKQQRPSSMTGSRFQLLYEYPATNMVTKNIGKYVHFAVFSADE